MKISVPRQPLGLIIMTFTVIIAIALLGFSGAGSPARLHPSPETISALSASATPATPLAELIGNIFHSEYTRFPAIILILIINAFLMTRLMVIYKASFGRSFLTAVLYAIAAVGIASPFAAAGSAASSATEITTGHAAEMTTNSAPIMFASLLLVFFCSQAIASFRRSYRFEAVFQSAFALGFIPLIYPPAIFLVLMAPIMLILYQRSGRETIVSAAGFMLPLPLCSVGWWIAGYPFVHIWQTFRDTLFHAGSGIAHIPHTTLSIALSAAYAAIVVISIVILALNYTTYPSRIRRVYLLLILLFLCLLPAYFLPSADIMANTALTAIPVAGISTHFFIKINKWIGLGFYILLIVIFFTNYLYCF